MQEIISQRTVRSKTFDNGDGTFTTQAHVKPIHYVDDNDTLQDVDLTLEDKGTYWELLKNTYTLRVAKDFSAPWLLQYKNQIKNWKLNRRANINIKYEPSRLCWVNNPDLSDMQVFRTQQAVTGIYNQATNVIRYTDAFGDGIHFEVSIHRSGFKKEIVIDALNKLEQPPTANHKFVALFKYDGFKSNNARLTVKDIGDDSLWDEDTYKESEAGFKMIEDDGLETLVRAPYIFDSSVDAQPQPIKVFWKRHNGYLWQAKVLPKQFLLNATYPVRADTDTTSSPDADTETDTVDGGLRGNWNSTWSTIHDQTTAHSAQDNSNFLSSANQFYAPGARAFSGLGYDIYRSYLSFKYNIASGQTVSAVTLALVNADGDGVGAGITNGDDDGLDYVNVYENTNSSGSKTSIATSDYNIANIDTVNPLATAIDISTMSNGSTETFTFNATGEGKITCDGTDKYLHISLLEGHDAEDTAISNYFTNNTAFRSAETASDPLLTITHSGGAAATFTPKIMMCT